jgi:HEAT repeat protein
MDLQDARKLADQAVRTARDVTSPEEYEAVWALLAQIAPDAATALELGTQLLSSDDPAARATGCDLLGLASERHESVQESVARAVLSIADTQTDPDTQWSIARALGCTRDRTAVPKLVELAEHVDGDVRFQAALALPSVWAGDLDGAAVPTMIRLTEDPDAEIRNWATFGLGFLMDVDTPAVRAALWARCGDDNPEARAEGIRGLARRHDRRAVPLLAELLDDEDGAHVHTFHAAEILGAPELLPHLLEYDEDGLGVADALAACDPQARDRRDEFAAAILDAVDRELPGADVAVYADWFEPGLTLDIAVGPDVCQWSVEALSARAGGDPAQAARLVADDLTTDAARTPG